MNLQLRQSSAALALLISVASANVLADANWESSVRIRATAGEYVSTQTRAGTQVTVGVLDERLRLPACEAPLQAQPASGSTLRGAVSIAVRCSSLWTVYVPVRIQENLPVVVLVRPLARGETITADALELREQDTAQLPYGYLTDPQQAIGRISRRSLSPGSALSPDALESPRAIKRGQLVTLLGRSGSIEVRADGKALGDAGAGERVRVENSISRRIVEGTARDSGVVEVNL